MGTAFEERLSAARVRTRARLPFFGALLLFARVVPTTDVELAATDGRDLFVNPEAALALRPAALDGLLIHEVLHAALLHVSRRGAREPLRWNVAADIVVNGIVATLKAVELPDGGVRDAALEHLPVEEVYDRLEGRVLALRLVDLVAGEGDPSMDGDACAARWREALAQAETLSRMGMGSMPAGLARAVREVLAPSLDWRAMLWRFVTATPSDFAGFDRRFVHRGLYLDALTGESLRVAVCIDTSGSVSPKQLARFVGELRGILGAYPHVRAELYFADAALYGPHEIADVNEAPAPQGGGGTSFVPFFEAAAAREPDAASVLVYLTDGFGTFPTEHPAAPTLWVVTPGGLADEQFPFGEVARLRDEG